MNAVTDQQLLLEYAEHGSEAAFAQLVGRHLDFVFSAARRMTGDDATAQDVTQGVFVTLAREAGRIARHPTLAGWLHCTARNLAGKALRSETRRRAREKEAVAMSELHAAPREPHWDQIAPHFDAALGELSDADRNVVLLRFFQRKSARGMAELLGITEAAAQRRVSRAVDRLREVLARRGVRVSTAGLVLAMGANTLVTAPGRLSAAVLTAALGQPSSTTTIAGKLTHVFLMSIQQKVAIALAAVALAALMAHRLQQHDGRAQQPAGAPTAGSGASSTNVLERLRQRMAIARSQGMAGSPQQSADIEELKSALREALHQSAGSKYAVRTYPPQEVTSAIAAFGDRRKEAFATLAEAVTDPDLEVRMRAVSALGWVGAPPKESRARVGITGEGAPEAKPLLWKLLTRGEPELSGMALSPLTMIGFEASEIPALASLMEQTTNGLLARYLPEAIGRAAKADPTAAAPLLHALEPKLQDGDAAVRFRAACALARGGSTREGVLTALIAGLQSDDASRHLVALETLEACGDAGRPALQAVTTFADATDDDLLRKVALRVMGAIQPDLRTKVPDVNEVMTREEALRSWGALFAAGNLTREDLFGALREPFFAARAAERIASSGTATKDDVPSLIEALSGQNQPQRDQILKAIRQIDPEATVTTVSSTTVSEAATTALMTLQAKVGERRTDLAKLLEENRSMNSDWRTENEVAAVAQRIAASDMEVYRAFVSRVLAVEPGLTNLIPLSLRSPAPTR